MAGARGIEPRSRVLETLILTVVLCPFVSVANQILTQDTVVNQTNYLLNSLFLRLNFVTPKRFLRFRVQYMLTEHRIILSEL